MSWMWPMHRVSYNSQIESSESIEELASWYLPVLSEPELPPDLRFWPYTFALLLGAVLEPSGTNIPEQQFVS